MDPKELLIAHGEKIVVPVVGVICVWLIWGTATSPEIRPREELKLETITQVWTEVERTYAEVEPPVLNQPPDLFAQMQRRFSLRSEARPQYSWLTAHPDLGKTINDHLWLYVYELPTVELTAKDQIGSVGLSITLPEAIRKNEPQHRLADARKIAWERSVPEKVVNQAAWVAVQVQVRISDGAWQPLSIPSLPSIQDGIIPLAQLKNSALTVPPGEAWAEHRYRARLIAKATGLPIPPTAADINPDKPSLATVIVVNGRFQDASDHLLDSEALLRGFRANPEGFLARCNPGIQLKVAGDDLAANERYYAGDWSPHGPDTAVVPTDEVRFALISVRNTNADPNAPPAFVATMAVTRLVNDPNGGKPLWTKPFSYAVKVDDMLGKDNEPVENPFAPGQRAPQNLSTPFRVVSIEINPEPRIFYYQYFTAPRPGNAKQKILKVKPITKTRLGEVVLLNTKTDKQVTMVQLSNIAPPASLSPGNPLIAVYPRTYEKGYNEIEAFSNSPATFQTFGKKPAEHAEHQPNTGPILEVQRVSGRLKGFTDTVYFELPDDRLIWWDHNNSVVAQWPEVAGAGSAPPKASPAPKPGLPPRPAGVP